MDGQMLKMLWDNAWLARRRKRVVRATRDMRCVMVCLGAMRN